MPCPPCQYPEVCSPGRCRIEEDPQRFPPDRNRDKLVAAMTPNGGYTYYPPFINVRREGGNVVVLLRGNEIDGKKCGTAATATFPEDQFAKFLAEASASLLD